jgi:chaperonin cofactor prefoldin
MVENTDEEHLDSPTNNQSENPPDEIIPITDTETINSIQESENMEVHHHAHDPAAPHHKKNWKSYFWEFLMLFLAVFCGFLAEYQLEHKIERDREKQYVQSLMNDLNADVINIDSVQKQNILVNQRGDSLFLLLTLQDYSNSTNSIYYNCRTFSTSIFFTLTDGTIKQLNNSGGLRLIKKKNVVDSLQAYQNMYSKISIFQDLRETQKQSYRDAMSKVFDVRVFETMVSGNKIQRPVGNPVLFSQNKELINELLMRAHFVKRNNAALINNLEELKQKALNLQKTITKEYHLD